LLQFITGLFTVAGEKIRKVRNILQNRTAVSLLSIFTTCVVIFLMTGALYFRNEVIITDGDSIYQVFTMQSEPEGILEEQGIVLTGLDNYSFGGFKGDVLTLSINRAFDVSISADGARYETEAHDGETVGQVLGRAGVNHGEHDLTVPEVTQTVEAGEKIQVVRAFEVSLYADGEVRTIPVKPDGKTTVADLLIREGLELGKDDIVSADLDANVYPKMEISVSRVKYVDRITVNSIPYETVEKASNLVPIGVTEITVAGVNGSRQVTTREKLVDGVVTGSDVISEEITNEPVTEVKSVGKALAKPYSKRDFAEIELVNGRPVNYEYVVSGKSCAYTAKVGSGTASGRKLEVGTVAVNPAIIPYGSLLYIVTQDGRSVYGAAVAADTGNFTDVIVDLYMGPTSSNYADACNWGARVVDVYVISTGRY